MQSVIAPQPQPSATSIGMLQAAQALLDRVSPLGADEFDISFSGSCGDLNGFYLVLNDADGKRLPDAKIAAITETPLAEITGNLDQDVVPLTVHQAAELIFDMAIDEAGLRRLFGDEGGVGDLTISLSKGVVLSFQENTVETTTTSYEWAPSDSIPGECRACVSAIAAVLRANGVIAAEIEYSGGGDSGEACDWFMHIIPTDEVENFATQIGWDESGEGAFVALGSEAPVNHDFVESNGEGADRVDVETLKFQADPSTGVMGLMTVVESAPVKEAIESILWTVLKACGHGGWENNEGGFGNLLITNTGAVIFNHNDNNDSHGDVCETTWSLTKLAGYLEHEQPPQGLAVL